MFTHVVRVALKYIAYPPPSFPTKLNHGWSSVPFLNDLPNPGLGSQARKPLLPVPIPLHTSLARSFCSPSSLMPVGKSLTQWHVHHEQIQERMQTQMCSSGTLRYVQQNQRHEHSYCWIYLILRFTWHRANTSCSRGDCRAGWIKIAPSAAFHVSPAFISTTHST